MYPSTPSKAHLLPPPPHIRGKLLNCPWYGLTYGFSQFVIISVYLVCFRFGAFQITQPTNHIAYVQFQNVFRAFAAMVFGAIAIGFANSFAPDYGRAMAAAESIFALLRRKSLADNLSEEGSKLVSNHLTALSKI